MILVDSSAWIDFLNDKQTACALAIQQCARTQAVVVGDLVLMEVLQGIRSDGRYRSTRAALARYPMVSLCGSGNVLRAAENYRALRKRGITVRGAVDVIIATWCIANGATIIHNDRDLAVMERELGLVAYVD